jgi:hypothetical protein
MQTNIRHVLSNASLALVMIGGAATGAAAQTTVITEPVETRTVVRSAPLELTPAQRTTIHRTIIPQGRGKQPIVRERVVTETTGRATPAPTVRERVVTQPAEVEIRRPAEVEYVVGDRVPTTAALAPVPQRVVEQVPSTSRFMYMVVNGRLLLVDPVTSTVVAEIVD